MKYIESYLKEHWYTTKRIGRLMMDLSLARQAYEESYENLPSSCDYKIVKSGNRSNASPVELTAIITIDQHRAEVQRVEKQLKAARRLTAEIEKVVLDAGLSERENEYVRLRYFQNYRAVSVAQRMFCSAATCGRLRLSSIEKIGKCMAK